MVHRDLKPSSVLIGSGGRARVMDFGIAARLHDALERERVVGTPGSMSPQATQGGLPTAATDVFSSGVMLVEAVCGHRLVTHRDPQLAMQRLSVRPAGLWHRVRPARACAEGRTGTPGRERDTALQGCAAGDAS